MNLIAEAMLAARTNRTEEAVAALTKLLSGHQAELGTQTALSFALFHLQLIGKQVQYLHQHDGRMGMDFLRQFDRIILNLKDMYLHAE